MNQDVNFLNQNERDQKKSLWNRKQTKNLSKSKIKEVKENLLELEKCLSKLKKYYNYGDSEYKGIREVGNLLNQPTDEGDYYKPIKTISVFHNKNNYIEYESKGDKNKNLSVMIKMPLYDQTIFKRYDKWS